MAPLSSPGPPPVELNVLDFGARGDGSTPDGDAVRRTLEALPPEGGRVRFPEGRAFLLDSVALPRPDITFLAAGARLLKAPEPAWHLFHDQRGVADGFRCVGGTFEMARDAFAPGETVSPFFFVRNRRLSFEGITVLHGIEEGLKLYTCRDVRALGCTFRDIRNNGIQFHAPEVDGFQGRRPVESAGELRVTGCRFSGIDDGRRGLAEGQGVAVHGTSREVVVRDVEVSRCRVDNAIRGLWAEFNTPGNPAREIHFHHNQVRGAHFHGIGLVGVHDGSIRDNRILDTGRAWPEPPATSDYTAGVVVSGSEGIVCRRITVARNEIVDTRPPGERRMQHGIVLTRGEELTVRDVDRIRGATREALHIPEPRLVQGEIG